MKLFGSLYDKLIQWSKHRWATFWLLVVSFIEAIFFPLPVDIMLIPMAISKPNQAFRYGLYAGLASTVGGIVGYLIGYYAFDLIKDYLNQWGYQSAWDLAVSWFQQWGILVAFVAGFAPIPYKIFAICAGALQMAFLPFILMSLLSRTLRFLLVAKLSAWGGQRFAAQIRHSIEIIGWSVIVLAIFAYFLIK
ncbi:hypothetical protein CEP45_06230 [Mergibacter septicus]|uniref:YqaA family protein n=1 Tax=Mergibacter septicus TaxID=221402 RepID=UPI001C75DD54|nr:YqaA family protein [Mergibacter septicus]QDJ13470.1 hypothetical protein CEP45_06230 [Mergibacter septicus]